MSARKKPAASQPVDTVELTSERSREILSLRQLKFCFEYVKDGVGQAAAIRAGYSPVSAAETASELLRLSKVNERLTLIYKQASDAAQVSAQMVISELYQVATADPRELVSLHRGACRFCWGTNGDYSYTPGEYGNLLYENRAANPNAPDPPMRGGIDYDFTREANKDCKDCRGYGTERVIAKDTRKLSRAAAKLIAGIKQDSKGAIEFKHRDQDGALALLGKITGVVVDRSSVEISGTEGMDTEALMKKNPKEMTTLELELAMRIEKSRLEARTIEGR